MAGLTSAGYLFPAMLLAMQAARLPHPEPRVIVSVTEVRGPHDRADVERSARRAWGKIVGCCKANDRQARGSLALELVVSGDGNVTQARRTGSTLKNAELVECLTAAIRSTSMPKAHARSLASAEISVAPGDPPDS